MSRRACVLVAVCAAVGCGDSGDPDPYRIALVTQGPGVVHVLPDDFDCPGNCEFSRPDGARLFLTAVPDRGARLASWTPPCDAAAASCVVSAAATIRATFEPTCPDPWELDVDGVRAMDTHPGQWLVTTGKLTEAHDIAGCGRSWSSPVVGHSVSFDEHGNVLVADGERVTLLAGPNGVALWSRDLGAQVMALGRGAQNRLLAAGTRDGRGWMRALVTQDGHTLWQLRLGPGALRAVATDEDTVWVAGNLDGAAIVAGYGTETGDPRWQSAVEGAVDAESVSVLPDGTVAVLAGSNIHLFDADSGEPTAVIPTSATSLTGPVAVGPELLYLPSRTVLGTLDTPRIVAVDAGFVYLASDTNIVRVELP